MQEHVVLPDDKRFDGKETMLQLLLLPFKQGDATSLRKMAMAAYSNDVATLGQLLDLPLDPDECFPNRFCPLLGAVDAGCVEPVRVLLEAGATVNKVDRALDSPLTIAVRRGYAALVDVLLEAKACVQQRGLGCLPPVSTLIPWGKANARLCGLQLSIAASTLPASSLIQALRWCRCWRGQESWESIASPIT
eukprot:s257_g31.t1